jgi:hypothetical protein
LLYDGSKAEQSTQQGGLFFDGKMSRCKDFVSLTAHVYHPLLRKVIPSATMECEAENSLCVEHFWKYFNEFLQKVSRKKNIFSTHVVGDTYNRSEYGRFEMCIRIGCS